MPFVSQKQAGWMFANKPKIAKEWASKTKSIKSLPLFSKRSNKNKG